MDERDKLKICICGGGSLGTVCAAVFASEGHCVRLLTGHPDRWADEVEASDPDGRVYRGKLSCVTSSARLAAEGADMVLLCVPGYLIRKSLEDIKPFIACNTKIGAIVSTTGFFFIAHEVLPKGTPLFGFQRVPYIARVNEYGKSALLLGYKDKLHVAAENCGIKALCTVLEELFKTPVVALAGYLEASLTNSNPLLHTARLYTMWKGKETEGWQEPIKFYAEWTDEASELLLAMDREFMAMVNALGVTPGSIKSILEHYEVTDAESLTRKIRSIPAFKNIVAPMVERDGLWYPDFSSRYFTEDFPFGLRFLIDLWEKNGLAHPEARKVWDWGIEQINKTEDERKQDTHS